MSAMTRFLISFPPNAIATWGLGATIGPVPSVVSFLLGSAPAGQGSDHLPVTVRTDDAYRDLRDPSGTWRGLTDHQPVSPERQKRLTDDWNQRLSDLRASLPEAYRLNSNATLPNISDMVSLRFRTAQQAISPLILDLDGDGVEISPLSGSITFDHNADGIRTGTAWAGADDGLLAYDRNGNGLIDSGRELFGNHTLLANGQRAVDGYAALRDLDQNASGAIDAADAAFARLRVWRDLDQDGNTDAGELRTLQEAGITQIGLSKSAFSQTLPDGTELDGKGSFVMQGKAQTYTDAWLAQNPFYSQFASTVEVSREVAALPGMQGSGAVRDLHEAASLSEPLRELLTHFQAASTRTAQLALVEPILKAWAATSDFVTSADWAAQGRVADRYFDEVSDASAEVGKQRLSILEVFNAQHFRTLHEGDTLAPLGFNARLSLEESFQALFDSVYASLAGQTRLKPYLEAITLEVDDSGVRIDTAGMAALIHERIREDWLTGVGDLFDLRQLASSAAQGSVEAADATLLNFLNALEPRPELTELLANERLAWLVGDNGDNRLTATGYGTTAFLGGKGNDVLIGNNYSNVYSFNRGDGSDTILDGDSFGYTDTIAWGAGITATDISAYVKGLDLVIEVAGQAGDQITVQRWFDDYMAWRGGYYRIESMVFADGSVLKIQALAEQAVARAAQGTNGADLLRGVWGYAEYLAGGDGDDVLSAFGHGDVLDGGAGDDLLVMNGSDSSGVTFIGGPGDDRQYGGDFGDTYVYRRGDGHDELVERSAFRINTDVLRFGEGIRPEDLGLRRAGRDLKVLVDGGSAGSITISDWFFDVKGVRRVEEFHFADGSVWTAPDVTLRALAASRIGTSGDDVLTSWVLQAERLEGGEGNDLLVAQGDGDVLDGGPGDDELRANDPLLGPQDSTFIGGTGNDKILGSYNRDVYVFNSGDGSDTIRDVGGRENSQDELRLGPGLRTSDVRARREQGDLIIEFAGVAADRIKVLDWFTYGEGIAEIERFVFSDGSVWSSEQMTQLALATSNRSTDGSDFIEGTPHFRETLLGGAGNDTLTAAGDGDELYGGLGDDTLGTLKGTERDTVFNGGRGRDTLIGSWEADTYQYERGDGSDTILEHELWETNVVTDTLVFGEGIVAADIGAVRVGNDMVLTIAGQEGDRITIPGWFADWGLNRGLEKLVFADGTALSKAEVDARVSTALRWGTEWADWLNGSAAVEHLQGLGGADTLMAAGPDDVLDGGAGNDLLRADSQFSENTTLVGGPGNDILIGSLQRDVYVFNRGDGSDTLSALSFQDDELQFGDGIRAADVGARRSGNHLVLSVAGQAGDQITIQQWFNAPRDARDLSTVRFSDGSTLRGEQLTQLALDTSNTGTAGNDVLIGTLHHADHLRGGDGVDVLRALGAGDVLEGGAGNDTLTGLSATGGTTFIGGAGADAITGSRFSDVYHFARGDGRDTIADDSQGTPNTDRLVLGEGISEQDVWLSRVYDDLRIDFFRAYGDRVQIKDWYKSPNQQIEAIQLSDGQALLQSQMNVLVEAMAAFSPPAPGQVSYTPAQQAALAPVLAASWI